MKQHSKQITLFTECFGEPNEFGYAEAVWVRTREEGELLAYQENTGKDPNNLDPSHPAYKLWTYRNKRDGDVVSLVHDFEQTL